MLEPKSSQRDVDSARIAIAFVRTAILLSLAASVALFIARKLHIDLGGLWVVLSAVSILKPQLSDSLTIARDQGIGTAVGVSFGAIFALLHEVALSVALAIFLTAVICRAVPSLRKVINIACVAAAIVILLPAGKPGYVTALDRFTDTLIGAAVALLFSAIGQRTYRWWPAPA